MRLRYVLYHGDCKEALKRLDSNSVHLVVSSPPYFVMRGELDYESYIDYLDEMKSVLNQLYRVLAPGRIIAINMTDYILDGERYDLCWQWHKMMREVGFRYRDTIIWEKEGELATIGAGKMASNFVKHKLPMYYNPNRNHEVILIFSKGSVRIPRYNDKVTEMSRVDVRKVRDYLGSVWRIPPRQDKQHPAVYPLELPYRLIQFYSYAGEIVLDPFAGTGTTGKAAKMLNRSAILCEINSKYINRIKSEIGWGEVSITNDIEYEYKFEVV